MTSQNASPTPSQALRVLTAALCASEEISYGNDDGRFNHAIKENQSELKDMELESVSRDIFYSPKALIGYISSAILDMDWEEEADLEDIDWEEYFDFSNAEVIFDTTTPSDSGSNHTCWIANMDKNWLITCYGYVGEYSDDDFDTNAYFSIHTNIPRPNLEQKLCKELDGFVAQQVSNFCSDMLSTKSSLPASHQHMVDEMLMKHLKGQELTKGFVASVEKDLITSHLNETEEQAVKPSKPRLI